jgi:hypothetical protein
MQELPSQQVRTPVRSNPNRPSSTQPKKLVASKRMQVTEKKEVQSHITIRRAISILSIGYLFFVYMFSVLSLFYDLYIEKTASFVLCVYGLCLLFGAGMVYSRKQIVTRVVIFLCMPALLPILLCYFGQWILLVPICGLTLVMFFTCGAAEKTKVIYGTCALLFYIGGALGFFVYTTLFMPDYKEIVIRRNIVSETGQYKCFVTDAAPNSAVGTRVYVEPNTRDVEMGFAKFEARGYKRRVYNDNSPSRQAGVNIDVVWTTQKRSDMISRLLTLEPELEINLPARHRKLLELPLYDEEDATTKVFLKDLTEEQYELLEIPEEGDVLYIDGELRFRYLVAVVEDWFDPANRQIVF